VDADYGNAQAVEKKSFKVVAESLWCCNPFSEGLVKCFLLLGRLVAPGAQSEESPLGPLI